MKPNYYYKIDHANKWFDIWQGHKCAQLLCSTSQSYQHKFNDDSEAKHIDDHTRGHAATRIRRGGCQTVHRMLVSINWSAHTSCNRYNCFHPFSHFGHPWSIANRQFINSADLFTHGFRARYRLSDLPWDWRADVGKAEICHDLCMVLCRCQSFSQLIYHWLRYSI